MRTDPPERAARSTLRGIAVALMLTLTLVAAQPVAAVPSATGKNAAVVTTWNQVAASIIPANPAAFLNYSFVHLAMYNAVNGITGRYELYQWNARGDMSASPEAAAAAAAHRILSTYFPGSAGTLDTQLAASLAAIPPGERVDRGVAFGRLAADHIIALRVGDGRGAAVMLPGATEAGDYSPSNGFATPWLGLVRPLALGSLTQFDPGPPPAVGSDAYREDLAEVRAVGAAGATGGARTLEQEMTAKYFAALPFGPMQEGLRGVVVAQGLDISDSARLFAATNTSIADAIGTAWNAKLRYMWWRPISAIRETIDDGDPLTVADPTWNSLLPAPPYPEWPSGLCSVISAMTATLEHLTGGVNLTLGTPAVGYRTWFSKAVLDGTAVEARIWSGIHFRTSDEVAVQIGTNTADAVMSAYFAATE